MPIRQKPCWERTPFAAPLRKLRLNSNTTSLWPRNNAEHLQFRDWVYATVSQIGKLFNPESTKEIARKAKAERIRAKYHKEYDWAEGRESPPRLIASKEVRIKRSVARQLAKLSGKIERFDPRLADLWRQQSESLLEDADGLATIAQSRTRHSQHPETGRILELMDWVHHETGRFHDREISELLVLAGLHRNSYAPQRLREMRSRHNSHPNLTEISNRKAPN